MAKKRSDSKWNNQFLISKKIFESLSALGQLNDSVLIKDACVAFRNPVVFDNQVSDAIHVLNYSIESDDKGAITKDHLIGTSNIVLYIYKNKLHEKWNTVEDFKNTIRALQVLLTVPKKLNDKGSFKNGWQFDLDTIDSCINWNIKLKREGITHLVNKGGSLVSVDSVWSEWHTQYKNYL